MSKSITIGGGKIAKKLFYHLKLQLVLNIGRAKGKSFAFLLP